MYDENQLVKVRWANKTRKHFESMGYVFTKYGDYFEAKAKDLPDWSRCNITVICDYCKKPYQIMKANRTAHLDKEIDACPRCRAYKQHSYTKNKRANKAFNLLRDYCSDMNYELITKEYEYTGLNMNIEYICKKHGLQNSSLSNLIHGHECIKCSYEKGGEFLRLDSEYVEQVVKEYNNNVLLNPSDYIGSNIPNLKIRCGSCGNIYTTSFSSYTYNNQIQCSHCSCRMSKGAKRINDFLISQNILFEREKTFDNCRDKSKLPFDFYLPSYNTIIEFDGKHHFGVVEFWGEDHFLITQKHDQIKNEFCKSNNINIIRIPYYDINNIESILFKKLEIKEKQIS